MLKEILEQYYEELKKYGNEEDAAEDAVYISLSASKASRKVRNTNNLERKDMVLQAVQDFNRLESPSVDEARLLAYIKPDSAYQRTFTEKEAMEIMQAYKKSAAVLTENNCTEDKETLASTIHDMLRGHQETIEPALEIYDRYLFDTAMVIDHIRGCMIRKPEVMQKGFNIVNKAIDAYHKKVSVAQKTGKKELTNYPNRDLPMLFSHLYSTFKEQPQNHGYFETLTEYLIKLAPHFETVRLWSDRDKPYERVTCIGQMSSSPLPDDWPNDSETKHYGSKWWGDSYEIKERILRGAIADAFVAKKPIEELYFPRMAEKEKYIKPMQQAERKAFLKEQRAKQRAQKKASDDEKYAEIRAASAKKRMAAKQEAPSSLVTAFIHLGTSKPTDDLFEPIKNFNPYTDHNMKPTGGLWASPIMENGRSDWENWLEEKHEYDDGTNKEIYRLENRDTNRYYFIPKSDCHILTADSYDKYSRYQKEDAFYDTPQLDYEAMSKDYDAFFLPFRVGDLRLSPFQMWSVQTLLVFNLDKFEIMNEQEYIRYKEQDKEKITKAIANGEDALALKQAGNTDFNHQLMLLRKTKEKLK